MDVDVTSDLRFKVHDSKLRPLAQGDVGKLNVRGCVVEKDCHYHDYLARMIYQCNRSSCIYVNMSRERY